MHYGSRVDFRPIPGTTKDDKTLLLYPRIVNKGAITTDRLVSDISEMSSFTPSDIAGLLVSFEERISYYLSEGHHVQLGDLGCFSAGLTARPVKDKKDIHSFTSNSASISNSLKTNMMCSIDK